MKLIEAKSRKEKRDYIKFIYRVYENDNKFRDLNLLFVKNFLYQQDKYAKRCRVIPLIVKEEEIKAVGMYIFTDDSDELKLSFLEFLPNSQKYLQAIIEYGQALGKREHLKKIVVGINGHVTYGLGILENNDTLDFEFNSNYNPNYYSNELDQLGLIKKKAISFTCNSDNSNRLRKNELLEYVYANYTFRCFNPRKFKQEMLIFGEIIDKAWKDTPYYSPKTTEELYDLMNQMRLLLKKEDIVFALKEGKEVGLVFSHPDYAEFFNKKKVNLVWTFIKLQFKRPEKLIYNAFGLLPECRDKGLAAALIYESMKFRMRKPFQNGVSSFIIEENVASMKVCSAFSTGINREFALYEILIN
jgi:hypothetical protein